VHHITFGNTSFEVAILIKASALSEVNLKEHYITPLQQLAFDTSGIIAFSVDYDKKKPSAKCRTEYLARLLPILQQQRIQYILCADGEYFKTLTKNKTADPHIGYVLPCAIAGFEDLNVCYIQNYQGYFYNPDNKDRTLLSLQALVAHSKDEYTELGKDVLHHVYYPSSEADIASWLKKLHKYPLLTVDIEAYSLKHFDAGIGTISFSWDAHSAVVFPVDTQACEPTPFTVWDKKDKKLKQRVALNQQVRNEPIRALLKEFFETYQGKKVFHNLSYDGVVLTYQLWMSNLLDRKGLEQGREVMLRNAECSQIITYLATNSCAGNELGLKAQAHEFVGNYAIDVQDIRLISLAQLLEYNAIDTCATWYVYTKNHEKMIQENQEEIYLNIFKPALYDIFEMHLTGMCLDIPRVEMVKYQLENIRANSYETIMAEPITQKFIQAAIEEEVIERNAAYKTKVIDASEAKFKFNLNSNPQMQKLLYTFMELPVIDFTDTKLPATGGDTIKKLLNFTKDESYKRILKAIVEFIEVEKILSSFITTFLRDSVDCPDGSIRIFGSFKLGGTLSGRLSSCMVGETLVQCSSGIKKLIDVKVGDLVPTHTGVMQPVLNVFDNGNQHVFQLTTQDGKSITCTSNHRLLTQEGFLSLEDMLNASENEIRQGNTGRGATSFNDLPQLAIKPTKAKGTREKFTSSNCVSCTGLSPRAQQTQNPPKGATTSSASRKLLTKRNAVVCRGYNSKFRRNSQNLQSTSRDSEQLHQRTGRRARVSKNVLPQTFISEDSIEAQNENCRSASTGKKIRRSQRVCTCTYSLLDGKRKQLQLRASSSHASKTRNVFFARRLGSTPYQRRQDRQQDRQLSFNDSDRAYSIPSGKYSPIVKINYVGVRRVYDLEVAKDHCYLANGIYVHNSNPNIQQLPSGSTFGKLIKSCFIAPPGMIFGMSDFSGLESVINTLLTKDPNKRDILLNNYDSHAFNCYSYWEEQFPKIQQALSLGKSGGKVFKVTFDTGEVKYLHESQL
jgi:DNA polymerase-1